MSTRPKAGSPLTETPHAFIRTSEMLSVPRIVTMKFVSFAVTVVSRPGSETVSPGGVGSLRRIATCGTAVVLPDTSTALARTMYVPESTSAV